MDERMRVVHSSTPKATPGKAPNDSCSRAEEDKDKSRPPAATKASANLPQQSVFAAGDCCCLEWPERESAHWFQMRLWSQARLVTVSCIECIGARVPEP